MELGGLPPVEGKPRERHSSIRILSTSQGRQRSSLGMISGYSSRNTFWSVPQQDIKYWIVGVMPKGNVLTQGDLGVEVAGSGGLALMAEAE